MPPIILQTLIYHSILFVPYLFVKWVSWGGEGGKEIALRSKIEYDYKGCNDKSSGVREKTWSEEKLLEFGYLTDRSFLRA